MRIAPRAKSTRLEACPRSPRLAAMPLTRFQDNSPARQPASQVHTAFALCSSPHHRSPRACLSKPLPLLMLTVSRIERAQLAPASVASIACTQQHVFAPKTARHRATPHPALQHCPARRSPLRRDAPLRGIAQHRATAQRCTASHRTAHFSTAPRGIAPRIAASSSLPIGAASHRDTQQAHNLLRFTFFA